MKWLLTSPMSAFDSETTGVNVEEDRIVTGCVAELKPNPAPTPWAVHPQSWLIDPGVDIPEQATAVHGITSAHAKEHGEQPPGALDAIATRLALAFVARLPVVGCNITFDFTILDRELRRYDLPTIEERIGRPISPVLDVYVLDKYIDPYRSGKRQLENLCEHYAVRIDGAHDSTADALAAARVAYRIALRTQEAQQDPGGLTRLYKGWGRRNPLEIVNRLVDLGQMRPMDLHDAQIGWRADQMASLQDFHSRKGKTDGDYNPAWPLIPFHERTGGAS